jgi:UDP-N-acetylglucosamine--N-acetylmuramyl-(pentapeptide) pyrophosphoryl-undecaprenol N-acetylglucosamine transferase
LIYNVQQEQLRIVFAGGGTGGHLFPAIAIAEEITKQRPGVRITFIGTQHKIESIVVPERGYDFESIWISGFRRKMTPENLLFPAKMIVALLQSFVLLRRLRPAVVVGTGGYVSGPPLYIASLLGIPTLIQEQNSYPGVTTRFMAARANEVHLSFSASRRYLKRKDNVHVSGNPTRDLVGRVSRASGASRLGLDPDKFTLLVFGGSLGARSINNAFLGILPGLLAAGIQLVWQTGQQEHQLYEAEASRITGDSGDGVKVLPFIERIEYAYAACDLAVCRAGATTIAELSRAGIPSILVPYPFAAADHQTENARAMEEAGAAVLVRDSDLGSRLAGTIQSLMTDRERLQRMRESARKAGVSDAAAVLARAVLNLAEAKHGRT